MFFSIEDDGLPKHPAISDVREAKVAALRKAIACGSYRISTDKVSGKVLESMMGGS